MGLDLKYLKGAPGPKFNEKKQKMRGSGWHPLRHYTCPKAGVFSTCQWWQQPQADLCNSPLFWEGRKELTLSLIILGKKSLCQVPEGHLCKPRVCSMFQRWCVGKLSFWETKRNPTLGMHPWALSVEATAEADGAGFTLDVTQTKLFLAHWKSSSCRMQYNTLWF